jgi:hypothetical protein
MWNFIKVITVLGLVLIIAVWIGSHGFIGMVLSLLFVFGFALWTEYGGGYGRQSSRDTWE